eukprot:3752492-Pyramimonas_sp.AAC.1
MWRRCHWRVDGACSGALLPRGQVHRGARVISGLAPSVFGGPIMGARRGHGLQGQGGMLGWRRPIVSIVPAATERTLGRGNAGELLYVHDGPNRPGAPAAECAWSCSRAAPDQSLRVSR